MIQALGWAFFNGVLLVLLYLAFFRECLWAHRVALFYVWVCIVMTTLVLFEGKSRAAMKKRGRSVPAWMAISVDLIIAAVLAGNALYWSAGFWVWSMLAEVSIFEGGD